MSITVVSDNFTINSGMTMDQLISSLPWISTCVKMENSGVTDSIRYDFFSFAKDSLSDDISQALQLFFSLLRCNDNEIETIWLTDNRPRIEILPLVVQCIEIHCVSNSKTLIERLPKCIPDDIQFDDLDIKVIRQFDLYRANVKASSLFSRAGLFAPLMYTSFPFHIPDKHERELMIRSADIIPKLGAKYPVTAYDCVCYMDELTMNINYCPATKAEVESSLVRLFDSGELLKNLGCSVITREDLIDKFGKMSGIDDLLLRLNINENNSIWSGGSLARAIRNTLLSLEVDYEKYGPGDFDIFVEFKDNGVTAKIINTIDDACGEWPILIGKKSRSIISICSPCLWSPVELILVESNKEVNVFQFGLEVIRDFDLVHVQSWFDGNDLFATWGALKSWIKSEVTEILCYGSEAFPERIAKAERDGYKYKECRSNKHWETLHIITDIKNKCNQKNLVFEECWKDFIQKDKEKILKYMNRRKMYIDIPELRSRLLSNELLKPLKMSDFNPIYSNSKITRYNRTPDPIITITPYNHLLSNTELPPFHFYTQKLKLWTPSDDTSLISNTSMICGENFICKWEGNTEGRMIMPYGFSQKPMRWKIPHPVMYYLSSNMNIQELVYTTKDERTWKFSRFDTLNVTFIARYTLINPQVNRRWRFHVEFSEHYFSKLEHPESKEDDKE